uniref:FLZ-type domain-containing protein n=1 Tax=Oryza brachyantha TaxID=4533 RepID=J3LKP3_ORYBR
DSESSEPLPHRGRRRGRRGGGGPFRRARWAPADHTAVAEAASAAVRAQEPRRRPRLSVLRRSAVRPSPAAATGNSGGCRLDEGGAPGRGFMGLGFLNCCYCCHRKLDADMDVFVYKGEHAFCSAECRCQQMAREERREIEMLVRRRREAFHSRRAAPAKVRGGSSPDDRHARLQIAA